MAFPQLIAHRGASRLAPENTLSAMRLAKKLGAAWVEFDVMLTADDVPIVFHDDFLNRTTNGHGQVVKTDYADLKDFDAGVWFGRKFQGEVIPTLAQYLQCAAELKLGINIELKSVRGKELVLARQVAGLLEKYWSVDLPAPLISSFSFSNLLAMRACGEDFQLGVLIDKMLFGWAYKAKKINAFSIHLPVSKVSRRLVAAILRRKLKVLSYTVNEVEQATLFLSYGVTSVFSDIPDFL